MNRLRSRHRLAPLALLGALTLAPACKKGDEQPAKQDDGKPTSASSTSSSSSTSKIEGPAPAGLVENPSDSPAIAEVGEVVATVQLPTGTKMSDIAAFLDYLQPGASMMLAMQLPAALEQAAGFDLARSARLDAPMSFVILNPATHPKPLALLVEAKDPVKLSEQAKAEGHAVEQRGDLVLIGPAGVVDAAKDFAFGNLTRYPDHSEIIVYPKLLLSSFGGMVRGEIDSSLAVLGAGNEGLGQMMRAYFDGLVALGEQTDRVVLSVGGGSGSADVIVRFYPVEGSLLGSFVAAQAPSEHTLLSKLPAGSSMMTASGDMRAGPARDAFLNWAVAMVAPMYGSTSPEEWLAMFRPWLDNFDGSFALGMNIPAPGQIVGGPPMQIQVLWGVEDPAAMLQLWREMLGKMTAAPLIEMMGIKFVAKHQADALSHDGVAIDLYSSKLDASSLPPDQAAALQAAGSTEQALHFAAFDKVAAMTNADADGQAMRTLIDTVRGKSSGFEISGQYATVLDASKQRGEAMLMYFDLGTMIAAMPPGAGPMPFRGMSFGVGKQGAALSMRMSLLK